MMISRSESTSFHGPIPPPSLLKEYSEIEPGIPGRIMAMAEGQLAHRQSMEKQVVNSDILKSYLGHGSAFVVAIVGIVTGGVVVYSSNGSVAGSAAGAAIAGMPLASIVASFLKVSSSRREERDAKSTKMASAAKNKHT